MSPEEDPDDDDDPEEEEDAPDDVDVLPLLDDEDVELDVVSGPPVQALTAAALAKINAARVSPRPPAPCSDEVVESVIAVAQNGHDVSVVRT